MNSDSNFVSTIPTAPSMYPAASALKHYIEQNNLQAQLQPQLQPQQQQKHPNAQQEMLRTPHIVTQPMPDCVNNGYPALQQTPFATPQRSEPPSVVVINNGLTPFGYSSQKTACPHCKQEMQTNLKHRPTFRTHIMALIFCATGLWCLAPLPYCMNSCQKMDHFCNRCKQYVGHSGK